MEKELIVVKLGSEQVHTPEVRSALIETLKEVSDAVNLVVTASGSVAEGINGYEKFSEWKEAYNNDQPIPQAVKQVASNMGNRKVLGHFQDVFGDEGVDHITLSHSQLRKTAGQEAFKAAIQQYLELGITPIINEGDVVATSELTWGDNDQLAAHAASILGADKIFYMTGENGLRSNENNKVKRRTFGRVSINHLLGFENLEDLNALVDQYTWSSEKQTTTGGIISKVIAGIRAKHNGVDPYILGGARPEGLKEVLGIQEVTEKRKWTRITGKALTLEQQALLEEFIQARKLKVPEWNYAKAA